MPTMGSLFDGIGGFVLAGSRHGITTLWASEIEAFPIAVTRHHFPQMRHVGDITKLDGAALPPVDIICGGSPCQDLSVASGVRLGLAGARSGLFMEQIRVIEEMRDVTRKPDGSALPRFGVWENVPGAFSSGEPKGEDFRIVLESFLRVADSRLYVPRPPGGRWESAGAVLGDQCSLAWRVYDTQYWPGTPQRRRRIYLVADFGGHTAPQILFEQHRLLGDSAQGAGSRESAAASAQGGALASSGDGLYAFHINQREEAIELNGVSGALLSRLNMQMQTFIAPCLNPWDTQQARITTPDGVAPTMACCDGGGGGRNPSGLVLCLNDQGGQRMDVLDGISGTLRAQMDGHPPLVFENHAKDARYTGPLAVAPTMSASYGTGGNKDHIFQRHMKAHHSWG